MTNFTKSLRLLLLIFLTTIYGQGQNIHFPYLFDKFPFAPPESELKGFPQTIQNFTFIDNQLIKTKAETFDQQKRKVNEIIWLLIQGDSHVGEEILLLEIVEDSGSSSTFKFDKQTNQLQQIVKFSASAEIFSKDRFYYTGQKLTEVKYFNNQNKQTGISKFVYNQAKHEIVENFYWFEKDKKKPYQKTIFNYNSQKQFSKKTLVDYDGIETETKIFEYNERGLLKKETSTLNKNIHFIYEYEFDAVGNWIKRTHIFGQTLKNGQYREDKRNDFDFRIISYY